MRPLDALLDVLRTEGVDRVFGNPGTTEVPFVEALARTPDMPYTLALHEGPAVAMADGYARATRRTAVASLHVAAGVANGLIGLMNASRSRTPLVVLAGQQDRRHRLLDPMLTGDLVAIAGAWTKSAVEVQHAADLPLVLRRAFAVAAQAPSGPVLVSIPMDILDESVDVGIPIRSATPPRSAAGGIEAVAAVLAGSEKPAIVAGDGVGRAGAVASLVRVAERLGAPVFSQPMFDRLDVPPDHPLAAGMLPPAADAIREALRDHDVVLVVGARAFLVHHYAPGSPLPEGARLVQLDDDPAVVGRDLPVVSGLVGDIGLSLEGLARALEMLVPNEVAGRRVESAAARVRAARDAVGRQLATRPVGQRVDPLSAAASIVESLPDGATIVEEAITVGLHVRRVLHLGRAGEYGHTVGAGLGWGIGAAIGMRLGDPSTPVVAVLGDGSAMFGLQGLWTAAHERVPVLLLVMNNGEYRTLKETIRRRAGRPVSSSDLIGLDLKEPQIDWAAAGRTFGVPTTRVERPEDLADIVAGASRLDGPLLVDVPIVPLAADPDDVQGEGGHRSET